MENGADGGSVASDCDGFTFVPFEDFRKRTDVARFGFVKAFAAREPEVKIRPLTAREAVKIVDSFIGYCALPEIVCKHDALSLCVRRAFDGIDTSSVWT